jgi:hypothetical protein
MIMFYKQQLLLQVKILEEKNVSTFKNGLSEKIKRLHT